MSLVIVGASGLVGGSLLDLSASRGYKSVPVTSSSCNLLFESSKKTLKNLIAADDDIVMLAAKTPEKLLGYNLVCDNITMLKNFLDVICEIKFRHLVYVSSDAIFSFQDEIINEQSPKIPETLYGYSHLVREEMLKSAVLGKKLTILRPCAIYGDGDTHNAYGVMRFIRQAISQKQITIFGDGEDLRDHVFVDDLTCCINSAFENQIYGDYNYATGRAINFRNLAEIVARSITGKIEIISRQRKISLLHRHFEVSKLRNAFPNHQPRNVIDGIKSLKIGA